MISQRHTGQPLTDLTGSRKGHCREPFCRRPLSVILLALRGQFSGHIQRMGPPLTLPTINIGPLNFALPLPTLSRAPVILPLPD